MKRFFSKASKPFAPSTSSPPPSNITAPHTTGLQPKDVMPPVPHAPYDHISLLAAPAGLLLRQHIPGCGPNDPAPTTHLRLSWSKTVKVEEISGSGEADGADWRNSVIIYGIVGVLELFSASYLLVISARSEVGNFLDVSHAVYGVKGITAIPLVEQRAEIIVNTLASRNAHIARPSLLVNGPTIDSLPSIHDVIDQTPPSAQAEAVPRSSPRVQFSATNEVKILTPPAASFSLNSDEHGSSPASPYASSSDLSFPSDEQTIATSPVAKTLASRLSFWSRLSKRTSVPATPTTPTYPEEHDAELESLDNIINSGQQEPAAVLSNLIETLAPAPASTEEQHSELEDKIVKECIREFTKGGMYFAYTFDITRSLQQKQELVTKTQKQHALLADLNALPTPDSPTQADDDKTDPLVEPHPTLPLWRRVDRQFWWNEWMAKPFVDAGVHPYVLPIMQGYYQIATFTIPPHPLTHEEDAPVDYIVVSRRSRDRAGLRYQRRGIDDDAHVANFVETETIMRVEREGRANVFSYVQVRGSIPLFWTQTGYGLKPPPLLATDRTHDEHLDAIKRHFQRTVPKYGPHTIINLAEQHGKEAAITQGYREYMTELADKDAVYHEYDFHTETKGMKYENISKLIDAMERTFEHQGYLWISDNLIMSMQKGVFRINCIDCLDRTNVVESAFARYVLNNQLGAIALLNPSMEGRTETDNVFNDVWANNGDAISRAYAGTSALKGDFTRTGKRDLGGMLNDGVNSLARMYTSTFSDWFCQAVIDFMLGNRTVSVFSEFLLKLQSTDPRDLIRLSKIRAEAIATSVSRVLAEGERLLSGWTLFAPEELNSRIGDKFEEKVLLLTANALYIISYDYTLEKVKMYTRVPLGDITGISKGAYILSPLEEASRDPEQNAGFVITWANANQMTRITSYSVRNSLDTMARTTTPPPNKVTIRSLSAAATSSIGRIPATLGRKGPAGSMPSARLLSASVNGTDLANTGASFAAFKVLPIDPARTRRASSMGGGGAYVDSAEELSGAGSCREAVDLMVDSIRRACEEMGNDGRVGDSVAGLVTEEDVVGCVTMSSRPLMTPTDMESFRLAEAQRMTSMYAKMEYGVKRLLWLGG
ncbi:SacI homology domain-containing protein [Mycena rosella]|uniref:SacI homology domain-containing protein n=1 Tax=Mycena rosella TaxID=1033263 RepID=A0AAD7H0Y2_MYCRO|nr:SacI homology domain-containing protein [Mycena rosella]